MVWHENVSERSSAEVGGIDHTIDDFEQMIYLISHDLRNSVRALIEIPAWIEEDLADQAIPIDGSLRENLDLINIHSSRLNSMFGDLLVYSRVGKRQVVQSTKIDDLVDAVMADIKGGDQFDLDLDLGCDSLEMGGVDVRTLFHALLENAVKHNPSGQGHIHIESKLEGPTCIVRITDDGPGISAKEADKVFDLFTTLKSRDEVEGSGMGLAISKKIARLYGGDIKLIQSSGSNGLTLELHLPAGSEDAKSIQ